MAATMFQTVNLVVQLFLLIILVVGYYAFRGRKLLRHARLMALAWAANIVSFLLIMVPSLVANGSTFLVPPVSFFDVMSIVHIPLGAAALLLSTFLVLRWVPNRKTVGGCFGKVMMRATMGTWITSIIIGTLIYLTMPS